MEINVTYLLTGQLQVFDNLTERDDLIPKEVGELLVCTSRSSHYENISDPRCVDFTGLRCALTKAKWMTNNVVLYLVALES